MPKPKLRGKHAKCGLADCKDEHKSLYSLPTCGDTRGEWLRFLFNGQVPVTVSQNVFVCGRHFASGCFLNEGQYRAGFASKLLLRDGSVPTIRDPAAPEAASSSQWSPRLKHVVCQTDPPASRTVATQLSLRTLQNHFRSTGTQVSSRDLGGCAATAPSATPLHRLTSAPTKRPTKRPHLDLDEDEEEEEEEEEGSFSVEDPEARGSAYSPADAATVTESTDESQASSPVQNIPKYIVYETCLLELFEVCPVCKRECEVRTGRLGTFLAVDQLCPHCRVKRSFDVGFAGFVVTTLGSWFYCRINNAKLRMQQRLIQDGLKNKVMYEGTSLDSISKPRVETPPGPP